MHSVLCQLLLVSRAFEEKAPLAFGRGVTVALQYRYTLAVWAWLGLPLCIIDTPCDSTTDVGDPECSSVEVLPNMHQKAMFILKYKTVHKVFRQLLKVTLVMSQI